MQEVRRCPVCGSIDVNLTYVEKRLNGKRYCKCAGCGYEDEINKFDFIGVDKEPVQLELVLPMNDEYPKSNLKGTAHCMGMGDVIEYPFAFKIEEPKRKINRPHYKELYEKEKIERAKLQAQFVCLKMINETLSKDNHTEKINILFGCIDAISKYSTDWYIKNEIKRAREKISKIK